MSFSGDGTRRWCAQLVARWTGGGRPRGGGARWRQWRCGEARRGATRELRASFPFIEGGSGRAGEPQCGLGGALIGRECTRAAGAGGAITVAAASGSA